MSTVLTPEAQTRVASPAPLRVANPVVRWFAALILIVYGFAKLNGSQFTVLDSELDKPMGTVSGFWLTWYYFGYSPVYGNLVAVLQIVGGLLLTLPRYALVGALLLLPVVVNIVLVDVFYGVDLGGTVAAVVLLALLLWVVVPHAGRLLQVVIAAAPRARWPWLAWGGRIALVVFAGVYTYWIANYNNRVPTVIDGVWVAEAGAVEAGIEKVFFERNRAFLAVIKDTSGNYLWRHFEVDPDGRIRVWRDWLRKGDLLFEGRYAADSEVVHLWPEGEGGEDALILRRAPH